MALPLLAGAAALPGCRVPEAVAAPAAAANQPRQVQAGAVMALLKAEHPRVDAALLARIGADVQAILIEVVTAPPRQGDVTPPMRQRALGWLQFYPNASSRAVLLSVLRERAPELAMQRVALRALAVAFGAAELPTLRDHLQHHHPLVREAAAHALGDIDDRRVTGILQDQLARDPELAVRDAIEAALQRIRQRERPGG